MASNPCCCCTLQTGVRTVAIFNIVVTILVIVLAVLGMTGTTVPKSGYSSHANGGYSVWIFILSVVYLAVCIVLLVGANRRHHGMCQLWFVVRMILLVLSVFEAVLLMNGEPPLQIIFRLLLNIGFTVWQLCAVYAFMDEIKNEERTDVSQAGSVPLRIKEEA